MKPSTGKPLRDCKDRNLSLMYSQETTVNYIHVFQRNNTSSQVRRPDEVFVICTVF